MAVDASALDFITHALRMIGLLDAVDTPAPETADDCLTVLQEMIDDWLTERNLALTIAAVQVALTALKQSYTAGSGGDFNITRPELLAGVSVIPDTSIARPIEIPIGRPLTWEEYERIPDKLARAAYPENVYDDHNYDASGLSTFYVYPVPTNAHAALKLYAAQAFSFFADLTTTYTFAPAYARAIRLCLGVELALHFRVALDARLEKRAGRALGNVKRVNAASRVKVADIDAGLVDMPSGGYNLYTDGS